MFGRTVTARSSGWVGVAIVLSIYLGEWAVYNLLFAPPILGRLLFNLIFALSLWCYWQTARTDPGTQECLEWEAWARTRPPALEEKCPETASGKSSRRIWSPGEVSWCSTCKRERPERAHHCAQCGYCVLRMDHHCPWIGNCVGFRNHKNFVLFSWWTAWACIVGLLTVDAPAAEAALRMFLEPPGPLKAAGPRHPQEIALLPVVGTLVAVLLLLFTGGMFFFTIYMVARNKTQVEQFYHGKNPYSYPSSLDNVRQLMGPLDWRFLLPLEPANRDCLSGTRYPHPQSNADKDNTRGYGSV